MKSRGLSQEGLKLIACVSMLLDHIGAVLVPGYGLRIIGRLAFPIYCFLLAEGVHHTRHPGKYAFRLLLGAVLAEVPYDLLFYGRLTWQHQSVMVTLLLGFAAGMCMKNTGKLWLKAVVCIPFALAGRWFNTDYGGLGVMMVGLFCITRNQPGRIWLQTIGLLLICLFMTSARIRLGSWLIPIQLFAAAAMVPIGLYSGRKVTKSPGVQAVFYLFYPAHLAALLLIGG